MIVLVLHAGSDRAVRIGALAVQGLLQLGLYLAERRTTDLDEIEQSMEDLYDGHLSLDRNPGHSVEEIFKHLDRVADVYPGGSGRWLSVVAVVAIGGLVAGALSRRRRDEALVARYCLLLIVIAFVGGMLHRFPFGPATRNALSLAGSTGGRHVLWMVPALAVGLALGAPSRAGRARLGPAPAVRRSARGRRARRRDPAVRSGPAVPPTGFGVGDGLHRLPRPARRRGHRPGRAGVPVRRQHRRAVPAPADPRAHDRLHPVLRGAHRGPGPVVGATCDR